MVEQIPAVEPAATQSLGAKVLRCAARLASFGSSCILLVTLLGWGVGHLRQIEYTCHLRPQMLFAALLLAPFSFGMRKHRLLWGAIALCAVLLPAVDLGPEFFAGLRRPPAGTVALRCAAVNVFTANPGKDRVIEMLRAHPPDIVALQEVDGSWARELESLADLYPTRHMVPRQDNFGIALFLGPRCKVESVQTIDLGTAGVPSVEARIRVEGVPLVVVTTHPLPPVSDTYFSHRNAQLEDLAAYAENLDPRERLIVLGDLNITPYAPRFRQLLRSFDLRSARAGFGINPTWPTGLSWSCRIAIDHVLHSDELPVLRFWVGPPVGSDHLPVFADFRLWPQLRAE